MATSDQRIHEIYSQLVQRMASIAIAIGGTPPVVAPPIEEEYDLKRSDTPSVGEVEYAFYHWNCAILTAFRGSTTLTPEQNYERNFARNQELKALLSEAGLTFRSVDGCYREAGWEKPATEICFFVTNSRQEPIEAFFRKIYLLAERFEQDSFLFTFSGNNRLAFLAATNDDGRAYFRSDIKFAGPLYTHVEPLGDWTDCSDGRISFRLRGMLLKGGIGDKRVRIGEGNLFDTQSYDADGLVIVYDRGAQDLAPLCRGYKGAVPLVARYFDKECVTAADVHDKLYRALLELKKQRCKRIGIHLSVAVDGSYVQGAAIVLDEVKKWVARNTKHIRQIVIVDIYGDYTCALDGGK